MRRVNSEKPYVLMYGWQKDTPESEKYLAWCDKHPEGFSANARIGNGIVVIHGADCKWGRGEAWGDPTNRHIKLTSLDLGELLIALEGEWPQTPIVYCGMCFDAA